MSVSEWGSEVYPGVFFSRGSTSTLHPMGGDGSSPEVAVERIHEAIAKCRDTVRRLTGSNKYLMTYLEERRGAAEPVEVGEVYDLPPMSSVSEDDRVVLEAIVENRAIIKEREAELEVLFTMIAGQHCAREAPSALPQDGDYESTTESSGDSDAEISDTEGDHTAPLEDVCSMDQLLGSGPKRNTFTL